MSEHVGEIVKAIESLTAAVEALTEEVGYIRSVFEETTFNISRDGSKRAIRVINLEQ
jgi:hypothetical protein